MSAPNGICRPPFRVAWGTQYLNQKCTEVGVSCSLKIRVAWDIQDIPQEVPERLRGWGESCFEGV